MSDNPFEYTGPRPMLPQGVTFDPGLGPVDGNALLPGDGWWLRCLANGQSPAVAERLISIAERIEKQVGKVRVTPRRQNEPT